jgi:Mannosyl-glycoprotein endo-beta-N-acetylglucosaminidase
MGNNILDSYLVKLGAVIDAPSFSRFDLTLKDAGKAVFAFAGNTTLQFMKLEATIVGALSAAGTGLITLADKTAMADQQYRLLGLRMLMTKESARAMSLAQEELGATLDEIAYDPELNRRFQYLYEQNMKLGQAMGTGFNDNMRSIRDIRMEYKRFQTELEFLAGGVVSHLFEKLGFGNGKLENQLHNFNDWVTTNLPHWADIVSDKLIPVWNNWIGISKDLGSVFKQAAGDFSFLTGILTGDDTLKTTEFSFKNLSKATSDWMTVLTDVAYTLQLIIKTGLHAGTSITAALGAYKAFWHGDIKESKRLNEIADSEGKQAFRDIRDFFTGKGSATNPDFAGINRQLDREAHGDADLSTKSGKPHDYGNARLNEIDRLAQMVSKDTGIPAGLIYGQWAVETGKFSSPAFKNLNNMAGIRIPGTTTYQEFDDLESFAKRYEEVLREKRYEGILNAKTPADFAAALKHTHDGHPWYEGSEDAYKSNIDQFSKEYDRQHDVSIGTVNIIVPKSLPTDQWSDFVKKSMNDIVSKNAKTTMAQTAGGAYY